MPTIFTSLLKQNSDLQFMYRFISETLSRYFKKSSLFRVLFNLSPMYRRSTGRIKWVSEDLLLVHIEIPLSYKNKNFVGTIFGGSLFSATDPIFMIQLIFILGDDYVVWDKSSTVNFKRPANEKAYAKFKFTADEIEKIKADVELNNEITISKPLFITNKEQNVFVQLEKQIYISTKKYYNEKKQKRQSNRLFT